jgi:hypothetical protein
MFEILLGLGGLLAIIAGLFSRTWFDAVLYGPLAYLGMAAVALASIGRQSLFAHFLFSAYGLGQVFGAAVGAVIGLGLRRAVAVGWRRIRR